MNNSILKWSLNSILFVAVIFVLLNLVTVPNSDTTDSDLSSEFSNENRRNKILKENVIQSIKLKNFTESDNKLINMENNPNLFQLIIKMIVEETDFEILYEYAEKTMKPKIAFHILNNLWDQIKSKKNKNLIQMEKIYKTFFKNVINVKNFDPQLISQAREICHEEIEKEIKNKAVEELTYFLVEAKQDTIGLKTFLSSLFEIRERLFEDVIKYVVKNTAIEYILRKINDIPFPANIYIILHLTLKDVNLLTNDNNLLLTVLYEKKNQNFPKLTLYTRQALMQVMEYVPETMERLVSSEIVHFKNSEKIIYICRKSINTENFIVDVCNKKSSSSSWHVNLTKRYEFEILDGNNYNYFMYINGDKIYSGTNHLNNKIWNIVNENGKLLISSFVDSARQYIYLSNDSNENTIELSQQTDNRKCHWMVEIN